MRHLLLAAALAFALVDPLVHAQELRDVPITGESLGGFVIPVEPVASEIVIEGVRGWAWDSDDTKRLQLEGDVRVRFGGYYFSAKDAVVWINRIPSDQGLINQIAIFFPQAEEPTRRAGLGASGKDLLVTGSTRGDVTLSIIVLDRVPPPANATLKRGVQRLRGYLESVARGALLQPRAVVDSPPVFQESRLVVGESATAASAPATEPVTVRLPVDESQIFRSAGAFAFSARTTTIETKDDCIILSEGVRVDYSAPPGSGEVKELQLSADRAVIFLAPGSMGQVAEGSGVLDAKDVVGIYLEGDVVATDFQYTLRGRRIYYDCIENRAMIMDAVLRTSMRLGLLAYARADEMRQLAAAEFTAQRARVSTSEFFTPHLSIGVERLTVTTESEAHGGDAYFTGSHATLRAGQVPFLYWPYIAGSPNQVPVKYLNVGFQDYRGTIAKSEWDLFDLIGTEKPDPLTEVKLVQELFSKNAAGLGLEAAASLLGGSGNFKAMGWYDFLNPEQNAAGGVVTPTERFRGEFQGDWRGQLASDATMDLQLSYFTDQNYVSTFRWDDYLNRREYETSGYINWQSGNSSLSLLTKFNPNPFLSNAYMIASRPYSVNKFPEVAWQRYGDSLFGDRVTWTQQYSANMMNLQVQSGSPGALGLNPLAFSDTGNFAANDSIEQAYFGAGYDNLMRARLYTRHELSMPASLGPVKVTPFVHGQVTGYLVNKFTNYATQSSDFRSLVGAGSRFSAEFTSNYNSVRSAFLDLNRLRHVIQPTAMLWYGWNSASVLNMPVYDQEVEAVSGAAAAQVGVTNRVQTMRGGPGNWKSVDWIVLDAGAVFDNQGDSLQSTETATDPFSLQYAQSPMPSFYAWRPEYSQWGDHIYANATMQCSDALSLYGQGTYLTQSRGSSINSFGLTDLGRGTIGASLQQAPDVRLFLEYRYVNTFDSSGIYPADEFLQGGIAYQISKKYAMNLTPQWDLVENNFRAVSVALSRTFPDFNLAFGASFNQIVNNTTFFASIRIPGAGGAGIAANPSTLAQGGSLIPGFGQTD
ncbi:MAG: hypothetical protein EXS03_02530 [Phycisphaerales bacterium]|nr:hypothetical protein [Phycisphaerales bacterium]